MKLTVITLKLTGLASCEVESCNFDVQSFLVVC